MMNKIELRLVRERRQAYKGLRTQILFAEDAYEYFKFMQELPQEELHALYLTSQNEVTGIYQVSKGTRSQTCYSPADVIGPALFCGATKIIIAHNHPSGSCKPSPDDTMLTDRISKACELMGLELLDHLIIGDNDFYSFNKQSNKED